MALVNYERDGQVVTLTLNRPEKLNAFSDELVGVLGEALHRFDTDSEAEIAILCGNGRAFSSGADVHQRQLRSREELLKLGGPQRRGTLELLDDRLDLLPQVDRLEGGVVQDAVALAAVPAQVVRAAGELRHLHHQADRPRRALRRVEAVPRGLLPIAARWQDSVMAVREQWGRQVLPVRSAIGGHRRGRPRSRSVCRLARRSHRVPAYGSAGSCLAAPTAG